MDRCVLFQRLGRRQLALTRVRRSQVQYGTEACAACAAWFLIGQWRGHEGAGSSAWPFEETALRKIGFGNTDALKPAYLRRLLDLELIEWTGHEWRLTALGQKRHASLVADTGGAPAA